MRLFISYAHKDIDSVRNLVDVLRQFGHEVWFDEQLQLGSEWKQQLREAIESNEAFVYAITRTSLASQWCEWEFTQAIRLGKPVIPVLLEEIPINELPVVIKDYQTVDLHQGFTEDLLTKFSGQLNELAINIPQENAPEVPEKPEGEPSRSPNNFQNFNFSGISGGNFNIGNTQNNIEFQTNIDTQLVGEKQREWTLSVIIGLLVAIISALAAIAAILPEPQRSHIAFQLYLIGPSATPTATITMTPTASPTSTPAPTFTPTPERMPAGFNVIVAGFAYENSDGSLVSNTLANDLSDIFYSEIEQMPNIDHIRGWRDAGVDHILDADPTDREAHVQAMAELLGADLVIYGILKSEGLYAVFEPTFYLTNEFMALEPDFVQAGLLGTPIEFLQDSDDVSERTAQQLRDRLSVIRLFVRGLSLYIEGLFTTSRQQFEEAIRADNESLEILHVFAGNAAIREPELSIADSHYKAALETRPQYARALIGRGNTLLRMAQESAGQFPPPYDPELELQDNAQCDDTLIDSQPQLLMMLAERCFEQARNSPDQTETADVDIKTGLGLGQVNSWLAQTGATDRWNIAEVYLRETIQLYDSSDPTRQARTQYAAGHAYAWLGINMISASANPTSRLVNEALDHLTHGVELLKGDANRDYNAYWINTPTQDERSNGEMPGLYIQQVEALEIWLASNS